MDIVTLLEPGRADKIQAPLELLKRCGGYYQCPKNGDGKRLGPLVGYAGRDAQDRQFVGEIYANFAKLERHSEILAYVAKCLIDRIWVRELVPVLRKSSGFCGAPEGGKALACQLARQCGQGLSSDQYKQYIFPEKEVTAVATETSRERSKLKFDRHEPEEGEMWWIVEDVCNNFSTTADLVSLIEKTGASVAGIVCFLNRSMTIRGEYSPREGLVLPVVALVDKPYDQYKQDDPFVAEDVAAGNVVWKPKKKEQWSQLVQAMAASPEEA